MPWAANGQIGTSPIGGGIEISDDEYLAALEGVMTGKLVKVLDGTLAVVDPQPPQPPVHPAEPTLPERAALRRWQIEVGGVT